MDLRKIMTETRNENSMHIDEGSTWEICKIINEEDKKVADAVAMELPHIAKAVDYIVEALDMGGRLFYMGSGTSGRLGILDAVECPPTYSTEEDLVQGLMAGGEDAFFKAKEGAEDDFELGEKDLIDKGLHRNDIVVGIAASGRTPYVLGGINYAKSIGVKTIGIACSKASPISEIVDVMIQVITGPEVVTGSTRMKAGTAQKMVLNMLSTATMIKLGKTYGNLMVDVKTTNDKLRERAKNIICEITNCDAITAGELLAAAQGKVKVAIVMYIKDVDYQNALELLAEKKGSLKVVING